MEIEDNLYIGTRPIKIHFSSNLPDGSSDIVVTRDLFYDPQTDTKNDKTKQDNPPQDNPPQDKTKTQEFPFFTDIVKYSIKTFSKYSRTKILETFFDKDKFKLAMNIGRDDKVPSTEIRNSNATHNMMVMLQLLFPTSFPIQGNIHDTFTENIKKETTSVPDDLSFLPSFVNNLIGSEEKNPFSYIRRSSGVYTIMEVFWINDVINHPDYSRLFRELYKQVHLLKQQDAKNQRRMDDISKQITDLYKSFHTEFTNPSNTAIVDEIKMYSINAAKRSTKGVSPERVNDILNKLPNPSNTTFATIVEPWFELYKLKLDAAKYNSDPNIIPPMLLRSFKQTSRLIELASEYEYLVASIGYASNFKKYESFMQKQKTNMEPWDLEIREKMSKSIHRTNVLTILKQFTPPKRCCSNSKLQQQLNSFLKNGIQTSESQQVIQYVMDLIRTGRSKTNGSMESLGIGVVSNSDAIVSKDDDKNKDMDMPEDIFAETKNEFYEIFLHLNCIEGILNNENLPLIKCSYENSNLVRMYEYLKHPLIKKNPMLLYSVFPLIKLNTLMPKTMRRKSGKKPQKGGFRIKGKGKGTNRKLPSLRHSVKSLRGGKTTRKKRTSK